MRALIQRVTEGKVTVDKKVVGEIGSGIVILLGITHEDSEKDAETLVNKIVNLRTFPSGDKHFETSLLDEQKEILVVSQFTLYGSTKKGRRPDFFSAAKPDLAERLYNFFVQKCQETGLKVATGQFQAMMNVSLVNEGPVTFLLET